MKKLTEPTKIIQFDEKSAISGRRVLLIGTFFGEPTLRAGVDEVIGDTSGAQRFNENITGLRFFDSATLEVFDVARGSLKAFINRNHVINAKVKYTRPFTVTMMDGGRFCDLPALVSDGTIAANDCFVVDGSFPKRPLVVDGRGWSRQLKRRTLVDYRQENVDKFYNF